MDPYTRARTVRIGKWRWPPPKEEMAEGVAMDPAQAEGFFEFKMRKMQQKMSQSKEGPGKDEDLDTSGEIQSKPEHGFLIQEMGGTLGVHVAKKLDYFDHFG
jgi:hypothetical protein